ncbi:MAG: hypothetical protein O2782_17625 [bacterium]|nr:hypothetical protein [bacterium]
MQNLRKSIFGALLGIGIAVGFGFGATQLYASVATDAATTCDTASVCPVKPSACPTDAKTSAATSCPISKGASI